MSRFRTSPQRGINAAHALEFAPSGDLIAVAPCASFYQTNVIQIWDVMQGKKVDELDGHIGKVFSLSFSPDGRWLASGGTDCTALVWDVISLKALEPSTVDISPEKFDQAWEDLAGADGALVSAAMNQLVSGGTRVVELLNQRIKIASGPDVNALIARLDSDSFDAREAAGKQLAQLGRQAENALREAVKRS